MYNYYISLQQKIKWFCDCGLQILTRSLSAAGSGLSTPKSSADTSWDAWPWQMTDSRPTNSSPRSSPELSMVLVPVEEGGRSRRVRRQQIRTGGAEGRSRSTGDSASTHRSLSSLILTHRAPPEKDTNMQGGVGCRGGCLEDKHSLLLNSFIIYEWMNPDETGLFVVVVTFRKSRNIKPESQLSTNCTRCHMRKHLASGGPHQTQKVTWYSVR